jgi:hypothetical protein
MYDSTVNEIQGSGMRFRKMRPGPSKYCKILYSNVEVGRVYVGVAKYCMCLNSKKKCYVASNRFARDDKEPGPSWGKQLPGERPRETAET